MSVPALEFLSVGEVTPLPGWNMPMHSHSVHELIVILSGRMQLVTDREDLQAMPGDLLLYRAGMPHQETSDNREPVNTLFISFAATEEALAGLPLRLQDSDARVRQMVTWLMRDHRAGQAARWQTPLLSAIISEMRRLCASPTDPWLAGLREHMQQNLTRTLYLADFARRVRMSKYAFVRKFKRLSGRTPMQELQLMRLNQARAMLLATGLPVKAIAPAVGLGDEYQMSKLFRRHFRLSPRQLRTRVGRESRNT